MAELEAIVHDVTRKHEAKVSYFGNTSPEMEEARQKANAALPSELHIKPTASGEAFEVSSILTGEKVYEVLEEMGIDNVSRPTPELHMALLREPELLDVKRTRSEIGLVIYPIPGGQYKQLYEHVLSQIGDEAQAKLKKGCPLMLYNLKIEKDTSFEEGFRIDLISGDKTENELRTKGAYALAFKGGNFQAERNQTFKDLVVSGRENYGDLNVNVFCRTGLATIGRYQDMVYVSAFSPSNNEKTGRLLFEYKG
ncbi:hypothetical protein ACFL0W_06830 [Nanoarchaeota archaeon]